MGRNNYGVGIGCGSRPGKNVQPSSCPGVNPSLVGIGTKPTKNIISFKLYFIMKKIARNKPLECIHYMCIRSAACFKNIHNILILCYK